MSLEHGKDERRAKHADTPKLGYVSPVCCSDEAIAKALVVDVLSNVDIRASAKYHGESEDNSQ